MLFIKKKLRLLYAKQQIALGIKYSKLLKRVKLLYEKRKRRIRGFLHKVTTWIWDYYVRDRIHTVVIGDISGIREDNFLGSKINQPFRSFPYRIIYQILSYKRTCI